MKTKSSNRRLKIPEDLLILERGTDELLLANGADLQPLYIRTGREYITRFLEAAAGLGVYSKILKAFPGDPALLDALIAHGILVPADPPLPVVPRENLIGEPCLSNKKGISLYLLLSQSCNLGCVYCLNGRQTYCTDKSLKMRPEIAFRSIERCLDDLASDGSLEVVFFGGEPLLNWPLAKQIILFCENSLNGKREGKIIKFHLTSNLSFLPGDLIEWAKKYRITVLCDVDGPEAVHNRCRPFKTGRPSHSTIVRNIKRLTAAGLDVDLRATVTALNQDHMLDTGLHHKEIGGRSSAFVPVNPVNSDQDIMEHGLLPSPQKICEGLTELFDSRVWDTPQLFPFNQFAGRLGPCGKTALACGAPHGNTPVIDVNGDVYPCIYLVGIKRFFLGNIMIASYPRHEVIRRMYHQLHVDEMEECKVCKWRYLCGGGCPVGRLTVTGNDLADDATREYCREIRCACNKTVIELLFWRKARETAAQTVPPASMDLQPASSNGAPCK